MNNFVRRPRRRPDQRSGGGMRRPSNGGFRSNRSQNIEHSFNNNGNNGYRNNGSHGAHKLIEKYNNLAREALASGDIILAENYYQHADHYIRIAPPQYRSERNGSTTETPVETTEIINKIPGVHLDEPQETIAANVEQAEENS